jgi:hypothetical protein
MSTLKDCCGGFLMQLEGGILIRGTFRYSDLIRVAQVPQVTHIYPEIPAGREDL